RASHGGGIPFRSMDSPGAPRAGVGTEGCRTVPDDAWGQDALRDRGGSEGDGRGFLVVSDDLVIRGGLVAVLGSAGVAHRAVSLARLAALDLVPWGVVLVWIDSGDGTD